MGERLAAVQRELDRCGLELDVLAAEALGDAQALIDVELFGRLDVLDAKQQQMSSISRVAGPDSFFDDEAS